MNPFTSPTRQSVSPLEGITRSALARSYNTALASGKFEQGRLNRALGLAQSNRMRILADGLIDLTNESGTDFYLIHTNPKTGHVGACNCKDQDGKPEGFWCKHRIAAALVIRAYQLETIK